MEGVWGSGGCGDISNKCDEFIGRNVNAILICLSYKPVSLCFLARAKESVFLWSHHFSIVEHAGEPGIHATSCGWMLCATKLHNLSFFHCSCPFPYEQFTCTCQGQSNTTQRHNVKPYMEGRPASAVNEIRNACLLKDYRAYPPPLRNRARLLCDDSNDANSRFRDFYLTQLLCVSVSIPGQRERDISVGYHSIQFVPIRPAIREYVSFHHTYNTVITIIFMIIECITRSHRATICCALLWQNHHHHNITITRQIKQQMQLSTDYLCDTMHRPK